MCRIFKIFILTLIIICLATIIFTGKYKNAYASPISNLTVTDNLKQTEDNLKIIRITPSGKNIDNLQQIVIEFNQDIVKLGQNTDVIAKFLKITPNVNCNFLWLGSKVLACNINQKDALKKATKYTITIMEGLSSLDGKKLAKNFIHDFVTILPNVNNIWFSKWIGLNQPQFVINFNQAVDLSSAEQALSFIGDQNGEVVRSKLSKISGTINSYLVSPIKALPKNSQFNLELKAGLKALAGSEEGEAQQQLFTFKTFDDFKFVALECFDVNKKELLINNNTISKNYCDPLREINLLFTRPILKENLKNNILLTPKISQDQEIWNLVSDGSGLNQINNDYYRFSLLPMSKSGYSPEENFKVGFAPRENFHIGLKGATESLRDEFNNSLSETINIGFTTGNYPPDARLDNNIVFLSKYGRNDPKISVINIDRIIFNYNKISKNEAKINQKMDHLVSAKMNQKKETYLSSRHALANHSGILWGDVSYAPIAHNIPKSDKWQKDSVMVIVSPYQLHFKLAKFNSLAWLSDLKTGQGVRNAKITIVSSNLNELAEVGGKVLNSSITDNQGLAILDGNSKLDPQNKLPIFENGKIREQLFAVIEKDAEKIIMPLDYNFAVSNYNNLDNYNNLVAFGFTSTSIYKAGEEVAYKIYVRDSDNESFILAQDGNYDLEVTDSQNNNIFSTKSLKLNDFGSITGKLILPQKAKSGWYNVSLKAKFEGDNKIIYLEPFRFLVSDIDLSSFSVSNKLSDNLFSFKSQAQILSQANLNSGGAYGNADLRLTMNLEPDNFKVVDNKYKDFIFATAKENFTIAEPIIKMLKLNKDGKNNYQFQLTNKDIYYGKLRVESAILSDKGKYVTAENYANYNGVERFVGLKTKKYAFDKGEKASINYVVMDKNGQLVAGDKFSIIIQKQFIDKKATSSSGFQSGKIKWQTIHECDVIGQDKIGICDFKAEDIGNYRTLATIKDKNGNEYINQIYFSVFENNSGILPQEDIKQILRIEDKNEKAENNNFANGNFFQTGDKIELIMHSEFNKAKALLSFERYGVLDKFIYDLQKGDNKIAIDLKSSYAPFINVSASLMEVDEQKGKGADFIPQYKNANLKLKINDKSRQIKLSINSDQESYKPRDKVKIKLKYNAQDVKTLQNLTKKNNSNNKINNGQIEIAVAVIDKAVFNMIMAGKNYFDAYNGFYNKEFMPVIADYSLITMGKNMHNMAQDSMIASKSALRPMMAPQSMSEKQIFAHSDNVINNQALQLLRNDFKNLAYWNPSLLLNSNNEAEIEFNAPDNLTSWKILAIAADKKDKMGLSEAEFKVNKLTQIESALPNQIGENDKLKADFVIINRSDKRRVIDLDLAASGDIDWLDNIDHDAKIDGKKLFKKEKIALEPFARGKISLNFKAASLINKKEAIDGKITFVIKAGDNLDADFVKYDLSLKKRFVLNNVADFGSATDNLINKKLFIPSKIRQDVGNVEITLSPSAIGNIQGAFDYVKTYPHDGLEQILSKAFMAVQYIKLQQYFARNFKWQDADKQVAKLFEQVSDFQSKNGGMGYFSADDNHVSPFLSAYTAFIFNYLSDYGYDVPLESQEKLHNYLTLLLKNKDQSQLIDYDIKAMIVSVLAKHNKSSYEDLLFIEHNFDNLSLMGKNYLLDAAIYFANDNRGGQIKDNKKHADDLIYNNKQKIELLHKISTNILSSANQTAGKVIFKEEVSGIFTNMLGSNMRENCALLSSFIKLSKIPNFKEYISDVPSKMVNNIMLPMGKSNWQNTQENVFCSRAFIDYANMFETVKPNMDVTALLDDKNIGMVNFNSYQGNIKKIDLAMQKILKPQTISKPQDINNGKDIELKFAKKGQGRLYYGVRLNYADILPNNLSKNSGFEIKRQYNLEKDGKWINLGDKVIVKRGDLLRVDLQINVPKDRYFVAVSEPVIGGFEPINNDLSGTIKLSDNNDINGNFNINRNYSFYHREINHDYIKFYADYLVEGNYNISYFVQAIATGEFGALGTRIEEIYSPDIYGLSKNEIVNIIDR